MGAPMLIRVDREGNIELPIVGKLKVAGMDMVEADRALQNALVPNLFRDEVVHVTLFEPEGTRVLVYGAVMTPGLVTLRHSERNLVFATMAAGGFNNAASGNVTLKRMRGGDQITANLLDPAQAKYALTLDPLENGDQVSVEAAIPNTVFVGGLVMGSHPQQYPPGTEINVLQALAAAGGLRTDVTPHHATLIRRMPDGKEYMVKLNLDRMSKGKDPNITLAAGDVLWVPETIETKIEDWINKNAFIRVGASATYSLDYTMPGIDYLNSAARQAQTGSLSNSNQSNFSPFNGLIQNSSLNSINSRVP
jgi:polysaccharide export outer membrane protein